MLVFRSCSSARRTLRWDALAARLAPDFYCTRPLTLLAYIAWVIFTAVKGMIPSMPIPFALSVLIIVYVLYERRSHYMNFFSNLRHLHRTVTVEGELICVDVQESGSHCECRLDEMVAASVTDRGMLLYFKQCAVLILSEDGEGYADFAARIRGLSKERTKKFRRSRIFPFVMDISLLAYIVYLFSLFAQ